MATLLLFARFFLSVLQFSFIIMGLVLVGFGLHYLLNLDNIFMTFVSSQLPSDASDEMLTEFGDPELVFPFPPIIYQLLYAMIILGSITLMVGLLGCCAVFQTTEMIALAGLLLTLILIVESVTGLYIYLTRDSIRTTTKEAFRNMIQNNYTGIMPPSDSGIVAIFWDAIMVQMECCGVDNFRDFALSEQWVENGQATIPPVCCMFKDKGSPKDGFVAPTCPLFPTPFDSNKEIGCFPFIYRYIEPAILGLFTLLVILCIMQLCAALLSCCICTTASMECRRSPCRRCPPPIVYECEPMPPRIRTCQCDYGYPTCSVCSFRGGGGFGCGDMGGGGGCPHIYCHHDFRS